MLQIMNEVGSINSRPAERAKMYLDARSLEYHCITVYLTGFPKTFGSKQYA